MTQEYVLVAFGGIMGFMMAMIIDCNRVSRAFSEARKLKDGVNYDTLMLSKRITRCLCPNHWPKKYQENLAYALSLPYKHDCKYPDVKYTEFIKEK